MKLSLKGFVIALVVGLFTFYVVNRGCALYESFAILAESSLDAVSQAVESLTDNIVANPMWVSTSKTALTGGFFGFVAVLMAWLYMQVSKKNFRAGEEHGSSRWGTSADIEGFYDKKDKDRNIILSQTEQLTLDKAKSFLCERNKNVLIQGGPGSGKSFGIIEPNLLQLNSSCVLTDSKGTILPEVGNVFKQNGYEIRILNLIDFSKSMHYNPLAYIKSEKDILTLIDVFMKNTSGQGEQAKEDFWVQAERLLYTALIAYLYYEAPLKDRNFPMLSDMIDCCGASESNENFKSPMDFLMESLEERSPNHFAVKQYKKFKQAAGKTLKSILISCAARLAKFDIQEVRDLMMEDELELELIGDRKTALFVIIPDTDKTFSFISAMLFSQMFNVLCVHADNDCNGKLPISVQFFLDEFANIGRIPDFEVVISTLRSRLMSVIIVLQSKAQAQNVYKDNTDTIIDCCDSFVFLGGKSTKTTKEIAEMIGKQTIDNRNHNVTKGQQGSTTEQNQNLGRDLIDSSEVSRIRRDECVVIISGLPPFRSKKYNLKKHPRFKQTAIADSKNYYDSVVEIERYREKSLVKALIESKTVTSVDLSELRELA